ncbi:hypothetical protein [Paracoccus sp. ME4]|uniref:hypothetical protein n=1 Tax=Paracoccus sp. ME4 TaxID=3138066 RepID=UPI00398B6B0E
MTGTDNQRLQGTPLFERPAMTAQAPAKSDIVYRDGFPEGWYVVHRPDTTLLVDGSGIFPLGFGNTICAAPRLCQGEAFLDTARAIAWALSGVRAATHAHGMAAFCDRCGIGPNCDEHGTALPNTRAERNWTCSHCDHANIRESAEGRGCAG